MSESVTQQMWEPKGEQDALAAVHAACVLLRVCWFAVEYTMQSRVVGVAGEVQQLQHTPGLVCNFV
jgi:hypothetical protein